MTKIATRDRILQSAPGVSPRKGYHRALAVRSRRVKVHWKVEVHWYEAHGIGRKDLKIKRYLEES